MTLRGYTRRKCTECGKRYARSYMKSVFMDDFEIFGRCSKKCDDKHRKRAERKALKLKVKKEAEFITKVAKEVIKLKERKKDE